MHVRARGTTIGIAVVAMAAGLTVASGSASAGFGAYVTSVAPASGSTAGGTRVVVKGAGLSDATGVTFGGNPGSTLQIVTDEYVAITSPAHAAGVVDVVVRFANTQTPLTTYDRFTYGGTSNGSPGDAGPGCPRSGPASAPDIDLQDPAATVCDPTTFLSAVDTECHPGQVDLNTASPAAMQAKLGHSMQDPRSIQGIIAMRPWLTGRDLSSVDTIGTTEAAEIAPLTCASQPTLPTPTPLACDPTKQQLDLQTASDAAMLAFGFSHGTVDQIDRARPLPQNLYQVQAAEIQWFTPNRIAALLKSGAVCVTPAPMLAGGAEWRWATAANGGSATRSGFSLIVPPGRITEQRGAYISVRPQADPSGLPAADNEIWGSWNEGSTTVAIETPWEGDTPSSPIGLHEASDGLRLSIGSDSTAVDDIDGVPTLVSLQDSLTPSTGGQADCSGTDTFVMYPNSELCISKILDNKNAFLQNAQRYGDAPHLPIARQCPSTSTVYSLGVVFTGISCGMTSGPKKDVTWSFTNNAYGSILFGLASTQVLYHYNVTNGKAILGPLLETDPVASLFAHGLQTSPTSGWLFGGQTLTVQQSQGTSPITVDIEADLLSTAAWAALDDVLSSVSGPMKFYLATKSAEAHSAISSCTALVVGDVHQLLGCFHGLAGTVTDIIKGECDPTSNSHPPATCKTVYTKKRANIFSTIGQFVKAIDLGSFAASVLNEILISGAGSGGPVQLFNLPTVASPGSTDPGSGRGIDGTITTTNDTSSNGSVLFKLAGNGSESQPFVVFGSDPTTAYDVVAHGGAPNPQLYDCLARQMPLRDWLPQSRLLAYAQSESGSIPTCNAKSPSRVLPTNSTNWILRENDGEAFFLDANSVVHPITGQGTYVCLAQHYFVLDETRPAEVAQFASSAVPATC